MSVYLCVCVPWNGTRHSRAEQSNVVSYLTKVLNYLDMNENELFPGEAVISCFVYSELTFVHKHTEY